MESYGSFKFLFTLCQILGLLPLDLKTSDRRCEFVESRYWLAYTKVLFFIFFLLQIHLTYSFWNWFDKPNMNVASKAVMSLSIFSLCIILPTIFITILRKKKDFLFWSNHIFDMITSFTATSCRNLNRFNIKLLATTLIFFLTASFIEIKFVPRAEKEIIIPEKVIGGYECLVLVYLLILFEAKMFLHYFLTFVYILGEVCRVTNRNLRESGQQEKNYWIHRLRKLRLKDWHEKDFVDFLHSYYIPVVSLVLLWGLAASIFNIAVANPLNSPVVSIVRSVSVLMEVLTVTCICYRTEQEARKILPVLHELFITCDDAELKEELEIFSLQVQHKQVEFNALGICKLDYTLVTSVVSTITTYIVILVQFQNDSTKEEKLKRQIMNCVINNDTLAAG